MATIVPVLGETIVVKISNGASPAVYTHPNVINTTRGITFSTSTETDELIDLADQSAPAQTIRRVRATDCKIDGAGMLSKADVQEWLEWAQSGEIKNIRVSDGTWQIEGEFVLTSWQISGDRLKSATCQITLEQAGPVTVGPAS
jgi:predicted secreted protein